MPPRTHALTGYSYITVQAVLFLLLIFGPHSVPEYFSENWLHYPGGLLCAAGFLIAAAGVFNLGKNLTPLPMPKQNATLVVTGLYRLVRHPIYCGILCMAFGRALWLNSLLTFVYALLLFGLFDAKSRFEEQLLIDRFPDYTTYRQRVRKLIPFIY